MRAKKTLYFFPVLFYLTMRQAATPEQAPPGRFRSSGWEKTWQGLKENRLSVSTDVLSTGTALKCPKKPSASPMPLRFITPLPSFMMHLQLLTLKQPGSPAGFRWGRGEEESMLTLTDRERRPAGGFMLPRPSTGGWLHRDCRKVISGKVTGILGVQLTAFPTAWLSLSHVVPAWLQTKRQHFAIQM